MAIHLPRIVRRLAAPLTWRSKELDMEQEMACHAEALLDEYKRAGLTDDEARGAVRRRFGSPVRLKEQAHDALRIRAIEDLVRDVRHAGRGLKRNPGVTATIVVSMALAIGANTTVLSVLNALVFRPLPAAEPDRLFFVQQGSSSSVSYPEYRDLRDRSVTSAGSVIYRPARMALDAGGGAERYWGYLASGNYFDVLGLRPAAGRFFHAADEGAINASPYAVLSYDLWTSRFGGSPAVMGRSVRINAQPYTVLGVAPRGFHGTEAFLAPSLWVPIVMTPQIEGFNWLNERATHDGWMIVRLKSGVSLAAAEDDLSRIGRDLANEYPRTDSSARLSLVRPGLLGDQLRRPVERFVTAVLIAAGIVLLAACVNVAGMLGARSADRAKEIAMRVSLGAGRGRIVRQLLTESAVLMLFAGAIGCAIAWVSLRFLSQWTPSAEIPVQVDVRPDAWVLTLSLLVSVATGLLAGLVPASHAWRLSASDARTGGSSIGRRRIPVRDVILLLQTAVCCAVVVGALVAVRGLARTVHTRPGYDADGVSAVGFDANLAHYSADEADRFQRRALEAVAQLPGVRAAAYAKSVPLSSDQSTTTVFPEAAVDRRPGEGRNVPYYSVSPGFFDAMGTRLLAGREFGWRDGRGAPPVAIVNETFARQFFGTVDAAGRRVRGFGGRLIQIVGVVEDGKYFTVAEDPRPVLFWSILQQRDTETVLLVRSGTAEAVMAGEMARVVRTLEPAMPLYGVGSLHDVLSFAYLPAQMASAAFGGFGLLAVMLAVTGVYSVSSYAVTRRRREIGIRIAIGARGLQVLGSVLGRIAVIVLAGATLGLVLGFASSRLLAFVVYQASPRDPLTLTLTAAFMIAVALVAGLGPIRQGIGADPCMLLHEE